MPPDEVRVQPADLVSHAEHVEAIAEAVTTARQAGQVVRLDTGAYGKLCTVVPRLLDGLQGLVIGGMDAAVRSLHDTGQRLRSVAADYQSTDAMSGADLYRLRRPS